MKCDKCGDSIRTLPSFERPGAMVIVDLSHADVEKVAHRCEKCDKVFCGSCCLPRWEAMKREKGLTGRQLADRLNADPDALFTEMPKCPRCGGIVEHVTAGSPGASSCLVSLVLLLASVATAIALSFVYLSPPSTVLLDRTTAELHGSDRR